MKQFRFILALAVAAWFECRSRPWRCAARGLELALKLWVKHEQHNDRARQRLAACLRCPIYYAKLETCGTPLQRGPDYNDENGKPMGCYCHMPTKVTTHCNCWMYDQTNGDLGWAKELNDGQPKGS